MSSLVAPTLRELLLITKTSCEILKPMVQTFYAAMNDSTSKLKADKSVFTIADGIVQHLLENYLYGGGKFASIVGEEESHVNITVKPFQVEDLMVPEEFFDLIENTREQILSLGRSIPETGYNHLNIFIDPIDGTREFATGLGEQCSICIGFSDSTGKPVAGIVFRPITGTYGAGAASEDFRDSLLDLPESPNPNGLLTSNGGISPFLVELMTELGYSRVGSGGAGNKMLMVLEGKGGAYIQDRGVSRWDTCAAQAVLEANGGILVKLTTFMDTSNLESYTYLPSESNLDFEPGRAFLTPFNVKDKSLIRSKTDLATDLSFVKPYSNLCGVFCIDRNQKETALAHLKGALEIAASRSPPAYD